MSSATLIRIDKHRTSPAYSEDWIYNVPKFAPDLVGAGSPFVRRGPSAAALAAQDSRTKVREEIFNHIQQTPKLRAAYQAQVCSQFTAPLTALAERLRHYGARAPIQISPNDFLPLETLRYVWWDCFFAP